MSNETPKAKDMKGYLYPNTNKNKPTQPDHTGKVVIEGKEYKLSAWENVTQDNKKYLSISVSLPNSYPTNQNNNQNQNSSDNKIVTAAPISAPAKNTNSAIDQDEFDAIFNIKDDDNPFN